ncbi:MAG: redoxin domain-containing protein [Actinobacteria bacterium]|nr:redoxin domain-containing protein [Actinomycetota bacterium]
MATHSATAAVGSRAPDFTLSDAEGRKISLSEELAKGPAVLVFLRGFA